MIKDISPVETLAKSADVPFAQCFIRGNKKLSLAILGTTATTFLESIPQQPRAAGITTLIYEQACQFLVRYAWLIDEPIEYYFNTKYPKLKAWALDPLKGRRVFEWTRIEYDNPHDNLFVAQRIFYPNKAHITGKDQFYPEVRPDR